MSMQYLQAYVSNFTRERQVMNFTLDAKKRLFSTHKLHHHKKAIIVSLDLHVTTHVKVESPLF